MILELGEERESFIAQVREFAEKEIAPGAVQRDEEQSFEPVYQIFKEKMAPKGWLGLCYPKEYGGMGKDFVDLTLALAEICRKDVSVGAAWSVLMTLGSYPIYRFGNPLQRQTFLPPLMKGEKLCAFAMTEINAGSDAAMQETTAEKIGDFYKINGRKIYITNAGYADTYTVIAMTDKTKGTKGISAFIVEKGTPGFTFGKEYKKMGIRSTVQRELIFEDCLIPKENLLGEEGMGFKIAMATIDTGRLGVAAQALGGAMGAYDLALRHAKNRVQFGKPIIDNQGVSFMLADMAMKIESARWLLLESAYLLSQGKPFSKQVAMAKTLCSDYAMSITTDAVQILGGKGYLQENEAERFMRDVKILQIYEGTNQIQRVVIAAHLMK